MNTPLLSVCSSRIRLLNSYNSLRSRIASGQYYGLPTVGNMLRVKWLLSVEAYTRERVHHCDSSLPDKLNVTIKGDPYKSNYTFSCEVIYIYRLFEEWYLAEVIDYMLVASFQFNLFGDFNKDGSYKRMSIEGLGCSINLNSIDSLTTEAFMGCGFCTSPPVTKPALNAKPCSLCDSASPNVEVIPDNCDYHFRSLCYARNSKIDRSGVDSDLYLMNKETGCDAQYFLITEKRQLIPRKIEPDPAVFYKFVYILPLVTIGLVVYYMTVVKGQKISELRMPKHLPSVR